MRLGRDPVKGTLEALDVESPPSIRALVEQIPVFHLLDTEGSDRDPPIFEN